MNIRELFKSFHRVAPKQAPHSRGLPSRSGMTSKALRWIVKSADSCGCGKPLPANGGVMRYCSKVCRLRRHNKNSRRVQRLVRRLAA